MRFEGQQQRPVELRRDVRDGNRERRRPSVQQKENKRGAFRQHQAQKMQAGKLVKFRSGKSRESGQVLR